MSGQIGYLSSAFRGVVEIPYVRTITPPEPTVDDADVTHLKSPARTKETIPTFITVGEVTYECISVVADSVQADIEADYYAGLIDPEAWSHKIADSTTGAILRTYSYSGHLTSALRGPISPTDPIMFNIKVKLDGAVTIS